ncbi:hypothetical protein AVEN_262042-1 [Araneus ventricosus]|uniref:Reverse transcriptase domain-containing protein n=1 Tax=Araneus ventricosus TaxID=182803 RepID=A0A4Y2Q2R4_ARAVE|nr:hypothetical protein AVEN_262042-1 [Araneus ventricosus]
MIHEGKRNKDNILVLSVDIKGAFDNIQHQSIVNCLDNLNCPLNIRNIFENLLQTREAILNTQEGQETREQKQGCPQGSCSGPALRNLVGNDLLNQDWSAHTSIQAFADDFVLVIKARKKEDLRRSAQESIGKFITWADNNNLEELPDKINYIQFRRWATRPRIYWKGERIKFKLAIKYLGVHIEDKLSWRTYLQQQATKEHQLQ